MCGCEIYGVHYLRTSKFGDYSMKIPQTDFSEIIDQLHTIPYFHGLGDDVLRALALTIRWQTHSSDSVLFSEGDVVPSLYHIHRGWVKAVRISPDGREQTLRFLGPGETFNEVGMLIEQPSPATVITMEPTEMWLIPREAVRAVLITRPVALMRVMENMAERLATLVQLVSDLSLLTVETRLVRWLLLSCDENGLVHRRRWATQAALAAHLGTTPDVLRRSLRALEDAGLIAVTRKQIRIVDQAGLAARVGNIAI